MNTAIFDVQEFHEKFKLHIGDPKKPDTSVDTQLRYDLIAEEVGELKDALTNEAEMSDEDQLIAIADALGDIAYTVVGAAVSWGIDLSTVWAAIHESNMTKSIAERREDGKVKKGPNYRPPDIKGALEEAKTLDAWWPDEEPQENSEEWIKALALAAAKPHKIKKAMKEIPKSASLFPFKGNVLKRGAFLFECADDACDRTLEVNLHNGTRGGFKTQDETSCRCGKRYAFTFVYGPDHDPLTGVIVSGKEI